MEKKLQKNWVETELGEILKLKNGYAFKTKDYREEGIPLIRIGNIQQGNVSIEKSIYVDKKASAEGFLIKKGDVLVAMSGATTGKYGVFNKDIKAYQNQRVGNLKPFAPDLTSRQFIFYLLGGLKKEIEDKAYGGAQPNISAKLIETLKIGLPPLAEQQRIVNKLDTIFKHLDALKTRLDNIPKLLKNFRQAILTQAVTGKLTEEWRVGKELESSSIIDECEALHWNKKQLKKYKEEVAELNLVPIHSSWSVTSPGVICEKIVDGTHKTPKYKETGIKFLSAKNIREWYIDEKGCKFISKEEHEELIKRCNPKVGSLLITKSGTIGRMAVVKNKPDYSLFESVAVMTPINNNINPYLLGYSLRVFLENGGNEKHVKGTAVQHLHLTELRVLPIQLPSFREQTEIVKRVENLFAKADTIEAQYQSLKTKIDSLPQAILTKAFKGELVEQLDTDGDAKELLAEIQKLKAAAQPKKKSH